jgi:hypothetical protein
MPKPFNFDAKGVAKIPKDWRAEGFRSADRGAQRRGENRAFYVRADGVTNGSWRRGLMLEPGRYRFEAKLRTKGVVAAEGSSGAGAGLRISGSSRIGINALSGDTGWQTVAFPIEATGGDMVLVVEMRASKGEMWCEKGSLQIVKVK